MTMLIFAAFGELSGCEDAMAEQLTFPKSVEAYLLDSAVRTGVDSLLNIKSNSLPNGLMWNELSSYYGAYAVAHLTKAEWAAAMFDLWVTVWGSCLPSGWNPAAFEKQIEEEMLLTPQECWNGKCLLAQHQMGDLLLYTGVVATPAHLQIAFSLESSAQSRSQKGPIIKDAGGEYVWQDDEDWWGWNVATFPGCVADPQFDLGPVLAAATSARNLVEGAS